MRRKVLKIMGVRGDIMGDFTFTNRHVLSSCDSGDDGNIRNVTT